MRKKKPNRLPVRVIERRKQVWKLYLRGWSEPELAERFKCSQPNIHNDLEQIRGLLLRREEDAAKAMLRWREESIAFYEDQKREAMMEWERSKEDKIIKDAEGGARKVKSMGYTDYLRVAQDAQKQIDRIRGTASPIKIDLKSEHAVVVDWSPMTVPTQAPDPVEEKLMEVERMLPPHDPSKNGQHQNGDGK